MSVPLSSAGGDESKESGGDGESQTTPATAAAAQAQSLKCDEYVSSIFGIPTVVATLYVLPETQFSL